VKIIYLYAVSACALTMVSNVAAHGFSVEGDVESGTGYVTVGGTGNVLKSGSRECITNGEWNSDVAIPACEGIEEEEAKEEVMVDEKQPEAAPEPVKKTVVSKFDSGELSGDGLFERNSDTLNATGVSVVDLITQDIPANGEVTAIVVTGHTDSRGSDALNQDLSDRRAANIASLLAEKYPAADVTSIGAGEGSPVASNETAEGRQRNRRVEVEITSIQDVTE